jgi:DNA-binding IclR family transcriptional regulator
MEIKIVRIPDMVQILEYIDKEKRWLTVKQIQLKFKIKYSQNLSKRLMKLYKFGFIELREEKNLYLIRRK